MDGTRPAEVVPPRRLNADEFMCLNKQLLKYGLHIMKECRAPKIDGGRWKSQKNEGDDTVSLNGMEAQAQPSQSQEQPRQSINNNPSPDRQPAGFLLTRDEENSSDQSLPAPAEDHDTSTSNASPDRAVNPNPAIPNEEADQTAAEPQEGNAEKLTQLVKDIKLETPLAATDRFLRKTSHKANKCVSPLVAVRGWALLEKMASGKTNSEIHRTLQKIVTPNTLKTIAKDPRGKKILGATRFFAEFPIISPLNEEVEKEVIEEFGPNAISRHCFSCDHDALRTLHLLNSAIANDTNNLVRYCVRDDDGPNRRALAVLISAVPGIFILSNEIRKTVVENAIFYDRDEEKDESRTLAKSWKISGPVLCRQDKNNIVLWLIGKDPKTRLVLYMKKNGGTASVDSLYSAFFKKPDLSAPDISVQFPCFSVSSPLCLRESCNDKKYDFKRVFDIEKCDLSGFLKKYHKYFPELITLWDHYHKTTFMVTDKDVALGEKELQVKHRIGFESRLERSPWRTLDGEEEYLRYREEYMERPMVPGCYMAPREVGVKMDATYCFDKPFYFGTITDIDGRWIVENMGYFSNVDCVTTSPPETWSIKDYLISFLG